MSARHIAFAALVVGAGHLAMCEADAQGPASFARRIRDITSVVLAEQLGTRLAPKQRATLPLGASVSGELSHPARLAKLGVAGAQVGARVTAFRPAEDKLVIEVDEIDPMPRTRRAVLSLDDNGKLSVPIDNLSPSRGPRGS